jgi:hypothetical protein
MTGILVFGRLRRRILSLKKPRLHSKTLSQKKKKKKKNRKEKKKGPDCYSTVQIVPRQKQHPLGNSLDMQILRPHPACQIRNSDLGRA